MRKSLAISAVLASALLISFPASAGDAAVFEDIGFSADGKTYLFGQYGRTDGKFEAWAEIYTVDVAKNDFVSGEVYKTAPSEQTSRLSGKKAFLDLREKTEWKIAKYNAVPSTVSTLIYIREAENKSPVDEIKFKDFEGSSGSNSIYYRVRLVPTYEGSGKNVRSKYYINLEKINGNSDVLSSWKVGTPDLWRKGISSYQIERIYKDVSGKSLVFIIQKTLEDETGTSIRYMVETLSGI
ncbi:MAG: DUF2259 domain-containing protein [Treponema sp.]|nr:DUF2259 domain-containing protein [Treponema sp.]